MDEKAIIEKMNQIEFHQSLMIKMISSSKDEFYKLVIERSLNKEEVDTFYQNCTNLSKLLEEQKEEGFVYFHALFEDFKFMLHPNLQVEEVIRACINQQLFIPLMEEFIKYL